MTNLESNIEWLNSQRTETRRVILELVTDFVTLGIPFDFALQSVREIVDYTVN